MIQFGESCVEDCTSKKDEQANELEQMGTSTYFRFVCGLHDTITSSWCNRFTISTLQNVRFSCVRDCESKRDLARLCELNDKNHFFGFMSVNVSKKTVLHLYRELLKVSYYIVLSACLVLGRDQNANAKQEGFYQKQSKE
jgi:hypothetical protein